MNPLDKFEISVRRKDDKITAAVPQLGLYATAADIHGALDALERKKDSGILEIAATIMIQRPEAKGARLPSASVKHSLVPTSQRGQIKHNRPPWRRQPVEQ